MDKLISTQLYCFLTFFVSGIVIGILFDIFRIIRKSFNISDIHTYIEDILFGILLGILLIFVIFVYNSGIIRWYMFISIILGVVLYNLTISKFFIKINVAIVKCVKAVINKILAVIIYPIKIFFKLIKKIFNKPFTLVIINIKKIKNIILKEKIKKQSTKKKDFNL